MNHETPRLVARTRLTRLLSRAPQVPLTLVSGPAGSGKTTLLDQWLAQQAGRQAQGRTPPYAVGRVDLGSEASSAQLWPALLRTLEDLGLALPIDPTPGVATALLGPDRLRALTAAIAGAGRDVVLVLDGPELPDRELAAELAHLLDRCWGRLHLVWAARVDPALPLYRYRLEDRMVEVRAADLAFTDEEAADLLRRDGTALPPESVHELNTRLGGWAAGLRFSARALAGRSGRTGAEAVAAVVAQDADIAEYLLGEVLARQDEATRLLLLRTSVPDLLLPGLAEELAGPSAGRRLQELVATNLFLEPVPGQPGCYRYPPFFRDLLRAQLGWDDPETADLLYRRAAAWLRTHQLPERALDQLAAGGLWGDLAQRLLADHGVATLLLGTDRHVSEVAQRIPFRVSDAGACVVRAVLALAGSDAATCGAELDAARGALRSRHHDPADPVPAAIAVVDALRACSAADTGTAHAAVLRADRSVAALPGSEVDRESEALVELARAAVALRRGELDDARAALTSAAEVPGLPTRLSMAVLGYEALTDALEGRLTRAAEVAALAVTAADDARVPVERRPAGPEVALALVALERDDLTAAARHVAAARASSTLANDPVSRTIVTGVLGHLDAAAGRLRPAVARLGSVEGAHHDVVDTWLTDWLRLQVAELWVAEGQPDRALHELGTITHEDHLGSAVVAAAAYAEQGRRADVEQSLDRARAGTRPLPAEVTRLLVQGVHESRSRAPQRALTLVERALRLAEEEDVRRPFREAPPTVRRLLHRHPQLLGRHPWLADSTGSRPTHTVQRVRSGAVISSPTPSTGPRAAPEPPAELLVEPLTARETEVLWHLEELLTTEEIAGRMFVSVNTVRTHVRSILRKLGVNRRNGAVRRARELGLLDHPERPAG